MILTPGHAQLPYFISKATADVLCASVRITCIIVMMKFNDQIKVCIVTGSCLNSVGVIDLQLLNCAFSICSRYQ